MKQSDIQVRHKYTDSPVGQQIESVREVGELTNDSFGNTTVAYCLLQRGWTYGRTPHHFESVCSLSSFARWAKRDITLMEDS